MTMQPPSRGIAFAVLLAGVLAAGSIANAQGVKAPSAPVTSAAAVPSVPSVPGAPSAGVGAGFAANTTADLDAHGGAKPAPPPSRDDANAGVNNEAAAAAALRKPPADTVMRADSPDATGSAGPVGSLK